MDPFTIAAIGSSLIGGGMNFINSRNQARDLRDAQLRATTAQKQAQDQYNKDFAAYQSNIRNLLGNRPELQVSNLQDALDPVLNLAQADLLASQGRAMGSEVRRDDIRQSTADQVFRAQRAARTGSDLMGAIGRIQAGEYAATRQLGASEAQERQRRIDAKTRNFQRAVETTSRFKAGEQLAREQALQADELARYQAQLGFESDSELSRMQSNLNFAIANINQQAANARANAALRAQNPGNMLIGLGGSLMQYGIQDQQLQLDANRYNNQ